MHTSLPDQASANSIILSALVAYSAKTQTAISAETGISQPHLSRILRGTVRPNYDTFLKIVQATGAPPTIIGLALIVGPKNIHLITRSNFLTRLVEDLPSRLLERLGTDVINADPRWAENIVEFVVKKTEETLARKRKADTEFAPVL